MIHFYTLWDVEVGNSLGTYASEDEALAVAHELIRANGSGYADVLELGYEDATGEWRVVATGEALVERARSQVVPGRG